jgi:hypothetical protein
MKVYIVIYHGIYNTSILKVFTSYLSAKDFVEMRGKQDEATSCWCEIEEMKLEA